MHAQFSLKLHQIGGIANLNALNYPEYHWAYTNFPPPDDDPTNLNIPEHNIISKQEYIELLADGLEEYDVLNQNNENISRDNYIAIAWHGLKDDSKRWSGLSQSQQLDIHNNYWNYASFAIELRD